MQGGAHSSCGAVLDGRRLVVDKEKHRFKDMKMIIHRLNYLDLDKMESLSSGQNEGYTFNAENT